MHYDQIFDRAMENVLDAWSSHCQCRIQEHNTYPTAAVNWNLDTGRDQTGRYVYWQE